MKTLIEEVEDLNRYHFYEHSYVRLHECLATIREHEGRGDESEYAIVYDTKHGAFWCSHSAGYTTDHREAGAYRMGEIAARNATLSCRYLVPYPIGTNLSNIPQTNLAKQPDEVAELCRQWDNEIVPEYGLQNSSVDMGELYYFACKFRAALGQKEG